MANQTWNIDTSHSSIHFTVRHLVFAKVRGHFARWTGTLQLDPGDLTRSSVQVDIEADSIDTGTPDRDKHLRSPDFLDVARFPKLSFRSKRIEKAGNGYRLWGDLTLHDVTREVALDVEENGRGKDPWGGQRAAFSAKTSINRIDYGLKYNQALETGGVVVGEKVDIDLEVEAVQAPAQPA